MHWFNLKDLEFFQLVDALGEVADFSFAEVESYQAVTELFYPLRDGPQFIFGEIELFQGCESPDRVREWT